MTSRYGQAVAPEPTSALAQTRERRAAGGRRRDEASHQAVLEAARSLLSEVGYARLTVEAIAKRSGVPKPTIYRWWDGKPSIVAEAIWSPQPSRADQTGDLLVDLRAQVERIVDYFARPEVVAALPGLVTESFTPDGTASLLGNYTGEGSAGLRGLLQEAQRRGDLRPGVVPGMVVDVVIGALFSRIIARTMRAGRPTGTRPGDVEELMAVLMGGVLSDAAPSSPM